jgi:hypothetical protein
MEAKQIETLYALLTATGERVLTFGRALETPNRAAAEYLLSQYSGDSRGVYLAQRAAGFADWTVAQ